MPGPTYCYVPDPAAGYAMRTVPPGYTPPGGADEMVVVGAPAADDDLEKRWPGCTVARLRPELAGAVAAACDSITGQIAASETQMAGFQNAARVVSVDGTPPTAGPAASAFDALAASYGMTPAALATLVSEVGAVSMQLLALQSGTGAQAAGARSAADLAAALTGFEAGLAAIVQGLNGAGLKIAIVAPAPIKIVGINVALPTPAAVP